MPRAAVNKCMLNGWMQRIVLFITLTPSGSYDHYYWPEYFLVQLHSAFLFLSWTLFCFLLVAACTGAFLQMYAFIPALLLSSPLLICRGRERIMRLNPYLCFPTQAPPNSGFKLLLPFIYLKYIVKFCPLFSNILSKSQLRCRSLRESFVTTLQCSMLELCVPSHCTMWFSASIYH